MAIIYKQCSREAIPSYTCDCGAVEKGRVGGVAFVQKQFMFSNISNIREWLAGIEAGQIIVIPTTSGTFDGGSPVMGDGYGDLKERLLGYDFTLSIKDPYYTANGEFWNSIKDRRDHRVAFMTATQVHLSEHVVYVVPKNPVEEDINSEVTWQSEIKWSGTKLSLPRDGVELSRTIFRCFTLADIYLEAIGYNRQLLLDFGAGTFIRP